MIEVEYFSIEGAPGRYLRCPSGMGTLSDKACGDSHKLSWQPESIACGRRFQCRNCLIGKLHAGELFGKESVFYRKVFCCRCERSANRLIHGSVCVSCYNRERELRIGRNARGTAPIGLKPLHPATLLVADKVSVSVRRFDAVTGIKEAILTYARMHDERLRFGWCAPAIIVR